MRIAVRLIVLSFVLCAGAAQAEPAPAELIERAQQAMRDDPEQSRRLAEQALRILQDRPDADLQIRAHLELCDYHSERSVEAARREIERARALLPQARRQGLRAGLLACEGELHQYAGENTQAMALFQQAVAAAEADRDEEMLAQALYERGYLRGLQGELAAGLAGLLAWLAWRHRRASRSMQQLAMTDELTGLPNRRLVLAQLDALLAANPARCALLSADIDHFKSINDQYGHLVGDDILRAVADAMRAVAREPIVIGRLGSEEFVLVLPGGDEAAAHRLAERVLAQVRALDVDRWTPGRRVSVSIGLTVAQAGDSARQMLRRADQALYAAKEGGRDGVVAHPAATGFAEGAAPA